MATDWERIVKLSGTALRVSGITLGSVWLAYVLVAPTHRGLPVVMWVFELAHAAACLALLAGALGSLMAILRDRRLRTARSWGVATASMTLAVAAGVIAFLVYRLAAIDFHLERLD